MRYRAVIKKLKSVYRFLLKWFTALREVNFIFNSAEFLEKMLNLSTLKNVFYKSVHVCVCVCVCVCIYTHTHTHTHTHTRLDIYA